MKTSTTVSQVYNIRIFCLSRGVHRHSGRYLNRVSTKVSVYISTHYRLTNILPTLNGCTLSADSRSMFGCYTADMRSTEHQHNSFDCCQFWMFRGFSLSKRLYSLKSQRDTKISWQLFASFSRLFPISALTRARYTAFVTKCAVIPQANYCGRSFSFVTWLHHLKTIKKPTLFCLNRNSCNFGGDGLLVEIIKTLCNTAINSIRASKTTCRT